MKFVKKITALFLALTMVMAMGITAFAAESGTADKTYTISTDDDHTYTVYQILTGTLAEENSKELGSPAFGKNFLSSKGTDPKAVAEEIANLAKTTSEGGSGLSGQALADKIAEYVNFSSNAFGTVSKDSSLTGVPAGYYLIKDTTENLKEGDSYSTYIVKVANDVKITAKKDTIKFQKKLKDMNDTTVAAGSYETDWQDSADYDIGDSIPFQLKATLPNNVTSYETYYVMFEDQMEKGLTFNNDVKVYVNGTQVTDTSKYSVTTTTGKASKTDGTADGSITANGATGFKVTINDVEAIGATDSSVITVEYTAKLNENAIIGSTGNVNEARLEYSNNPNKDQDGTGKTEWDNVIVFTYKVIVDKTDSQDQPLKGAEFTLYKKLKDGTEKTIAAVTATSGTQFSFSGLDDGQYVLKETKVPAGYNKAEDITFTVTADHDIVWDTQARTEVLNSLSGGDKFSGDVNAGSLSTTVKNSKGSELPETGGMGTTVLYIAGIAMIVAAGIVVIARKRNA